VRLSIWKQQQSRGFSLMEVLVALIILSIGLLGTAAMQLAGLRYGYSANLVYVATLQANDMADRIRANPRGLAAGHYNRIVGTGSDPGCINSTCTPAQMAATDAFQWNSNNALVLPSGIGTVSGSGAGSTFTITVAWTEVGPGNSGNIAQGYTLRFQP
jgi:type IV pilus assembly protein PilV